MYLIFLLMFFWFLPQVPFDRYDVAFTTQHQPQARAGCGSGRTTLVVGPPTTRTLALPSRRHEIVSSPGWTWHRWVSATSSTLKIWHKSTGRRNAAGASSAALTWLTQWCLGPYRSLIMPGGPHQYPATEDFLVWMGLGLVWDSEWVAVGPEMGAHTPAEHFLLQPSPLWDSPVPVSSVC